MGKPIPYGGFSDFPYYGRERIYPFRKHTKEDRFANECAMGKPIPYGGFSDFPYYGRERIYPFRKEVIMDFPKRKLPRLKNFDYASENYYYVTICTAEKKCLFGSVNKLSAFGSIVQEELEKLCTHYQGIRIDKYVVMPNHLHVIIILESSRERKPTLSTVVGGFKAGVSRRIHKIAPGINIWQKSFYDSVIRNERMYQEIWKYIEENPLKWKMDEH